MLRSGHGWPLLAHLRQLKVGLDGKGSLLCHLWCSNNRALLWIDYTGLENVEKLHVKVSYCFVKALCKE